MAIPGWLFTRSKHRPPRRFFGGNARQFMPPGNPSLSPGAARGRHAAGRVGATFSGLFRSAYFARNFALPRLPRPLGCRTSQEIVGILLNACPARGPLFWC